MKRLTGSRIANAIIIIAVISVPLLYSGLLTWTYEDPMARLDRIPAAVVNLDQEVSVTPPGSAPTTLAAGAELSDRLVKNPDGENVGFAWTSTTASQASEGLKDGRYLAVLTIPSDFSRQLSRLAGDNAPQTQAQTLQIQTNDGINYLAGTMAENVARELENVASAKGAQRYLDEVLVSLSTIRTGMDDAASGAKQLEAGGEKLQQGSNKLASGAQTLADGNQRLADGGRELASGNQALASGSVKLVTGLKTLASGAIELRGANGMITTGANQLADGSARLASGTGAAASGAEKLNDGVSRFSDGVSQLQTGAAALLAGITTPASPSLPSFSQGLDQLASALRAGEPNSLVDGANQLAAGGGKISAGLDKAAAASGELAAGAAQVDGGIGKIAAQFQDGTQTNPTIYWGVDQLASGADRLQAGSRRLAEGMGLLAQLFGSGDNTFGAASENLAAGATQLAGNASQLAEGLGGQSGIGASSQALASLVGSLAEICANQSEDPVCVKLTEGLQNQGLNSLAEAAQMADQSAAGISRASAGAEQLSAGANQLAAGANQLSQQVAGASAKVQALAAGAKESADGAQQLAAGATKLRSQIEANRDSLAALKDGSSRLTAGLKQLEAAFSTAPEGLRGGFTQLQQGLNALAAGVAKAGVGANSLDAALQQRIIPGIRQLAGGAAMLVDRAPELKSGAAQLASGTKQLDAGAKELADKTPLLADGARKAMEGAGRLAAGSGEAANGAGALQSGATKAAGGASTLAEKLAQAAAGANTLATGADQLADGTSSLQAGAGKLADGLGEGAEQIPFYSDAGARAVAATAAHPINVDAKRMFPAAHNGIGFAPFFMALALYVGAIAMFFVFPALDVRRAPWEKWYVSALRTFGVTCLLGVLQAAAAVIGLQLLLNLDAKELWPLFGVMMLASICFVSINQACVAAMGYRGRFVSVVLLILQISSMGATFPIETAPAPLRAISPYLPMTHLAEGIRTTIVGGGLGLSHGVAVISVWMVASWVITLIAAKRRSGFKPMPYDPALAFPGTAAAAATEKMSIAMP